jgi:hypothetical protein
MANRILNKLIHDVYIHRQAFPYSGLIPLDTYQWHDTFDGFGMPNRDANYLLIHYYNVLDTANENFQHYRWRLKFVDDEANKVYLKYDAIPELVKILNK